MGAISLRLPDSLHQLVREMSAQDRVSLNQFIASAVAEKASAFNTEKYIGQRAARASQARFEAALAQVPDVSPSPEEAQR